MGFGVAGDASRSDSAPPADPELERLVREQKIAEARKATAEAEKAVAEAEKARIAARREAVTAGLPTPLATAPDGTVTMGEGAGHVAELLAHALVDHAATELADQLRAALDGSTRVLIVEDRDLVASDWPYTIVRERLTRLRSVVEELTAALAPEAEEEGVQRRGLLPAAIGGISLGLLPAAIGGISLVTAGVGAVADLVGLLRTSYTVTGRTVAVSANALVAAVAGALQGEGTPPVVVDGFGLLEGSALVTDHAGLLEQRDALMTRMVVRREGVVGPAQTVVDDLRAAIAEESALYQKAAGADTPDTARVEAARERLADLRGRVAEAERELGAHKALVAAAQAAIETVDTFAEAVTAQPDGGGYPPLVAAAFREQLHVAGGTDRVLFVALDSAGGEHVTREGLFSRSGWTQYVAGGQLSWLLAGRDGAILRSGTRTLLGHLTYKLDEGPGRVKRVAVSVG